MGSSRAQLVRLDQLQGGDRGEHLVHRADAEPRGRGVGHTGLAVGLAPGVLEQHLAVAGDQHGPGELISPGPLRRMGCERRQRLRLGHPMQHQIHRARRPRGGQQLHSVVGASGAPEPDVVHPDSQRALVVGGGQAQPNRLARPGRHIQAHLGGRAARRIVRRGVEDIRQHIALGHRVDGRRGPEEVDPELLVRLGSVIGQGLRAAEGAGTGVEDTQLQAESTLQPQIPVQDARPRAVHVGHHRELALRRIGQVEGDVGIALGRLGRLVAVGVHEPAPRAATHGLPTRDRAGLEVIHDHGSRPSFTPDEDRA
jgi:hypothetical protein